MSSIRAERDLTLSGARYGGRSRTGALASRTSLIALFLFCLLTAVCFQPQSVQATWTDTGTNSNCIATEEVSDTSLICTVSVGDLDAGNVFVIVIATNNVATVDGETTLHSISDSGGNTWTKACEFTNGQGTAAAGATVSIWFSKLTTTLTNGSGTITLTTASAVTDKVMGEGREFTIGAGNVVSVEGACQTLANDGADAGSQTISSLTSGEYLFFRGVAAESNAVTSSTPTTNYSNGGGGTGCQGTTGGGEASDMADCSEYRIFTGTGDTSNPTLVDTTNDNASVYVALKEAAPPEPGACPLTLTLLGVGCFVFLPGLLNRRRRFTLIPPRGMTLSGGRRPESKGERA